MARENTKAENDFLARLTYIPNMLKVACPDYSEAVNNVLTRLINEQEEHPEWPMIDRLAGAAHKEMHSERAEHSDVYREACRYIRDNAFNLSDNY